MDFKMKCPKCKTENLDSAKFCNECGHRLSPILKLSTQYSSYDKKLKNIQRYLPSGLTDKILEHRDKVEGERRQVTVMFCDMEGFTKFVEKIGPEKAFVIMDQIYEILIHKVHDFGGIVNEMTGDGILALFGAPIALEDAPLHSLRSALSIHREIAIFNQQQKVLTPIRMRIGINTGRVVLGSLGNDLRVEFKAVGDTVNLASRMEGLAEPGTTYVTESTFKLTNGLFRFKAMGAKEVKGKQEAVFAYKLLSAKDDVHRPRLGFERQIYSTIVGRDKELNRLELQVMKAINDEGSVVSIIGEAGIGKSRLVAELKKCELMKKVTFLEGRAISIGRNLSFHLVIDILKQWARIREKDSEAVAFSKLQAAVRSLFPEEGEEVIPFVAVLMRMKLSGTYAERVKGIEGEALENLILKNIRELLIKATRLTPLVIVTEDLHWADISSIMLMESLFRLAETHRILFINVFRPGHKETGDRISQNIKEKISVYYVEIELKPLDKRMSEALITNMLDISGFHHAGIKEMIQRAGGNPFFMEEVVRSLIDEGAIIVKDGKFQVTERISRVVMPNSINDVLMVRIDRIEEKTQNLLKLAAVIGRRFFYRILSEVASNVEDIDTKLSYLKEIEIIRERERMGELEYLFKHALAQEVAYESIMPQKRKELHRKVACSIEKVFAERLHEFYGMLAYHYGRAKEFEKTEEYLIKAGEEALKSSASNEALNFYQDALDLYLQKQDTAVDPEKVAMIEKNIALAYYNRGRYEESIEYFDKALNYYWGSFPKNLIPTAFTFLTEFSNFLFCLYFSFLKFKKSPTTRDIEAVDLFFRKLKALAVINPMKYFVESFHFYKRVTNFDLAKFEIGIGLFVGASTLFSFTGISFMLSRKILDLIKDKADKNNIKAFIIYDFSETMHNYFEGNWKAIKAYDDDLVKENLSMGELYWTSQHYFWHGCPKHYQGCFDVTQTMVDKLVELSEVYGNDLAMLLKYLLNTNLLMDCGKIHGALVEIESAIEFGQNISQGSILIEMYSRKAHIHLLMGDIEDAEKSLKLADKVRGEINTVPWQVVDFLKSQLEYDLYKLRESKKNGSKNEISDCRRKAKKSAKEILKVAKKVAQNRTDSYRLVGVYYWLIDKQEEALSWWQKSIATGEHLDARLELSRTYFEIGKHLLENTSRHKILNEITAKDYVKKAGSLFEEMDLRWDLDEMHKLNLG
jgi:class 3 adenylate cyclase/tetratricopeptide (TPR) repeat protein